MLALALAILPAALAQDVIPPPPFDCAPGNRTSPRPTTVHALRLADIDVVAALGDSITAAFASAAAIPADFREFRGESWSIGGDADALTLATVLREHYNPDVRGMSFGVGSGNTGLNVAVSGAESANMESQAARLVDELRAQGVGPDEFKMVTIFIGGNDLCRACNNFDRYSSASFREGVAAGLDVLAQVPNMIVSLVSVVDVTNLYDMEGPQYPGCAAFHSVVCSCGTSANDADREVIRKLRDEYNEELIELAQAYDRDDFAVVYQPFYEETRLPVDAEGNPIRGYLSPADCFHYSTVSHQGAASALFNNLVEPVGSKDTMWRAGEPWVCPGPNTYIYTNRNSAN